MSETILKSIDDTLQLLRRADLQDGDILIVDCDSDKFIPFVEAFSATARNSSSLPKNIGFVCKNDIEDIMLVDNEMLQELGLTRIEVNND